MEIIEIETEFCRKCEKVMIPKFTEKIVWQNGEIVTVKCPLCEKIGIGTISY